MDIRAVIGRFRRVPYPRTLATLAGAWLVYLILGYFLAPRWIAQAIPEFAAQQLQRKASVGSVRVNPLLFRVLVRDFALTESDGAPIVAFKRLLVDFELSSIVRWAWTFSSIRLDGLDLRAEIRPDGTLNLAALGETLRGGGAQEKSDGRPPRLLLQHAALRGGRVTFTDRTISTPTSAVLEPLDLELRDISTLPDPRGPYTVSAILRDGGVLFWRGDVALHPIHSQGEVAARRIRLSTPWRFLRDRVDLAEPGGMIEFSTRYRFSYADETTDFALENTRLAVTDVRLAAPGAPQPMLALEAAEMTGARFNLIQRELVVPTIEVYKGLVAAAIDAKGALDWQGIVKETRAAQPAAAPAPGGKPWKIRLESVHASEIALRVDDRSRVAPLAAGVADFEVSLAAEAEMGGEGMQARVRGLDVRLGKVTLGELDVPAPIASLQTVQLAGGSLDLGERRVAVDRVAVSGGTVRVVRDKTGGLRLMDVLTVAGVGTQRGETAPLARAAVAKDFPWRLTLDAFELGGVRVSLADETFEPAVAYDFDVRAVVRNISADGKAPVRFETALRVAQGGTVNAAGDIRDRYSRLAGTVKVDRVALKPLEPVISRNGALKLESGELSADVKAEYRAGKEHSELRASGRAGIANFLLNETESGDRLMGWKEIAATGVAFTLHPDRLAVEEVRLTEPGAKIVIFKDRSLNLVKAFQPPPAPGAARAPDPPKPPATGAAQLAGPSLDIAVERVRVEGGAVDFSDLSLVLPFAAKVEEFSGSITGISSDTSGAAALKLEGKVGEFGLANVGGTLKPFQPKVHTDVGVVFRNVELVPLSPYSATFAGRRIATGRVSLDLRYKIENSQLAGDNRVVLERFTLGEQVDSPGAVRLPYDLAIALLTDSEGRINVAVPVKGNVDDPQFSYGHLIWQAIATVITNIVTAPFRALAGLFGGGGENLENIAFDAGRATLQPPEREKLKRVADGIAKRPQLVLVAEGQHGDADAAALRERDVALAIAAKLGRTPAPGAAPDPVNPLDGRTQRAMEALFIERASAEALQKFVDETEKARGKPVDRANPVLALAGRGSADADFYRALLARLNETARVPPESLQQLADARSRAVAGYMRETLSVPESRLAAKTAAAAGAPLVKLSFDVARPAQKP